MEEAVSVGVLYARAFTQQALLDAWDQVRDAALADGRPDRAVDIFEQRRSAPRDGAVDSFGTRRVAASVGVPNRNTKTDYWTVR
ncbi:MAG: hypothetical protein ACT4NY_13570 [Pseudonocardiales bacterium]